MDVRRPTVLVISGWDDETANAVVARLRRMGAVVVRTDTGDFPRRMTVAATMTDRSWRGHLTAAGTTVPLHHIRAIYYRRPTRFDFPGMSGPDAMLAAAEARHGLGGTLAALDALWINDPSLAARAEYKPLQLRVAADSGLRVPPTLVANDYHAALRFADAHGDIVCKPLSSLVLGDADGRPMIPYTTRVDVDVIDPAAFASTTNLLQQWVPKVMDCRVTAVGHESFAAAISASSEAGHVDWRTDYSALTYTPVEVPSHVHAGLITYLRTFGLHFAAFDFGVDDAGQWWFYEANPNGEWLWIEKETGMPISASIANLLVAGRSR